MEGGGPRTRPDTSLATAAKPPLGLVVMLGTLTALGPLAIDMYLPALPSIARSFGATEADAAHTVAVFLIGLCFGQLIYGPLSDRYGRRGPILIGIGLYLVGSLGCLFAPSMQALLAARLVQALGACSGMVLARAVIRDRFQPSEVLHVLSLLMLVMGLAPILAPLFGGWLLLVGDWRLIFAAQVVAGVAVGLAVLFRLKESRSEETAAHARLENPLQSYLSLLRQPLIRTYLLAGGFSGAALFAYISSAPDVLIVQHHVPPHMFGWVFGINAVGIIAGTQINARLARRWPSYLILRRAVAWALVCALVLLAFAMTDFGGLWGVIIPLFGVVGSHGFTQSNAAAEAMKVDSRRAGATAALTGAASFGAGSLASALAGFLSNGTAAPMAIVMVCAFAVAMAALAKLSPARGRREG